MYQFNFIRRTYFRAAMIQSISPRVIVTLEKEKKRKRGRKREVKRKTVGEKQRSVEYMQLFDSFGLKRYSHMAYNVKSRSPLGDRVITQRYCRYGSIMFARGCSRVSAQIRRLFADNSACREHRPCACISIYRRAYVLDRRAVSKAIERAKIRRDPTTCRSHSTRVELKLIPRLLRRIITTCVVLLFR